MKDTGKYLHCPKIRFLFVIILKLTSAFLLPVYYNLCMSHAVSYHPFCIAPFAVFKSNLRWPDTIYLREGQLFWNHFFSCSTAFYCWDILDAEKGMLEVYQKHTFIEIDTNIRKFSAIFLNMVFKQNDVFPSYYSEQVLEPQRFQGQVSDKSAPCNLYNKRWLK